MTGAAPALSVVLAYAISALLLLGCATFVSRVRRLWQRKQIEGTRDVLFGRDE